MSTVTYPHIEFNADGVPIVSETTTKVVEIVQDHLAHHWDAEQIHRQYPYLTLAKIHAALTYYYDHQQEIDADIDRRLRLVEDIKSAHADDTLKEKLRTCHERSCYTSPITSATTASQPLPSDGR